MASGYWLENDADYSRVELSEPALPPIDQLAPALDAGRIMAGAGDRFQVVDLAGALVEEATLGHHARLGWYWLRKVRGGRE